MEAQIYDEKDIDFAGAGVVSEVEICVSTSDADEVVILDDPLLGSTSDTEKNIASKKDASTLKSKDFECDQCNLILAKKSTLEFHKTFVHVDESYYACEFCSASKIHWSEYFAHQCTNTDSKPLKCPLCEKTVSTKKQVQAHEEIHALQRRFNTRKLDDYFVRKLAEIDDPAIDWGAKPFICGVCGKPFAKMYEVEYHEKLHSEEREPPNKCEKCGMKYISKNDLNKHTAKGCNSELYRKTEK